MPSIKLQAGCFKRNENGIRQYPKAAYTQPTAQTEQSLNLNSAHEMPAVAHAPRFGTHSAAVYNDEIETSHFADVQAACNLPTATKGCMMATAMAKAKPIWSNFL